MSFLKEHCSLFSVNEPKELEGFNCGDLDIDEFFAFPHIGQVLFSSLL